MGTCYYPEHWDKKLWADDLDRMKKTGISVIRIAEFAWSKVEPEEGVFTYDFFDEFLDLCSEKQMKVIFGTPTATPPAWLTEKYPEVLNARKDGVLLRHGGRRHYNYNSPVYQRLCARQGNYLTALLQLLTILEIILKISKPVMKELLLQGWMTQFSSLMKTLKNLLKAMSMH